ncbi:MAG: carbon-nitrogen hydrolase family protein [Planctomycetaceae bacterium]
MPDANHPASNRRSFLQKSALGSGLGVLASGAVHGSSPPMVAVRAERLPREVWIATISQQGLQAGDTATMVRQMLSRMDEVVAFHPDIVCLPETFPYNNVSGTLPSMAERAEEPDGELTRPFAGFAAEHNCYVVCPIYTRHDGRVFNTAVIFDRKGQVLGEYHKMHPTTGEMDDGISPGSLEPPVFQTDFGVVGIQICFDIEWDDGWQKLQQAGAEIVFWPSAFAGGLMVNTKAWQHRYCVVSSTAKDTSKICDITGEVVAQTSRWNHWVCAPLNLEKAFLHTWPYVRRFPEIQARYGRDVLIHNFADEEWSIIESRSADVKVADVLKEFDLHTLDELTRLSEARQCECR